MKTESTEPVFSMLSICFLLIAGASALVSMAAGYESIRPMADWICGISLLALLVSLINDARR